MINGQWKLPAYPVSAIGAGMPDLMQYLFFNTSRHSRINNRNGIGMQFSLFIYHRLPVSLLTEIGVYPENMRMCCVVLLNKTSVFLTFCVFGSGDVVDTFVLLHQPRLQRN